jgi:hypothetical protein
MDLALTSPVDSGVERPQPVPPVAPAAGNTVAPAQATAAAEKRKRLVTHVVNNKSMAAAGTDKPPVVLRPR